MSSRIDLPGELETAEWRMKMAARYLSVLKKTLKEKGYEDNPYWIEKALEAEQDAEEKRLKYGRLKSARSKDTAK